MNQDTSEFHIRAVVRDCLTEPAADKLLNDTAWLTKKTQSYLEYIARMDASNTEQATVEFNAELKGELRELFPSAYRDDD